MKARLDAKPRPYRLECICGWTENCPSEMIADDQAEKHYRTGPGHVVTCTRNAHFRNTPVVLFKVPRAEDVTLEEETIG